MRSLSFPYAVGARAVSALWTRGERFSFKALAAFLALAAAADG